MGGSKHHDHDYAAPENPGPSFPYRIDEFIVHRVNSQDLSGTYSYEIQFSLTRLENKSIWEKPFHVRWRSLDGHHRSFLFSDSDHNQLAQIVRKFQISSQDPLTDFGSLSIAFAEPKSGEAYMFTKSHPRPVAGYSL